MLHRCLSSGMAPITRKKRGDAGDRYQLSMSVPVLDVLIKHCRSGFPSLPQLRNVIVALEADYKILQLKDDDDLFTESHNAADMWRIMCRHCRELKMESKSVANPRLQAVIDMVVVEDKNDDFEDIWGGSRQ